MEYITMDEVIELHDEIINRSGGETGIYPEKLPEIENLVYHAQNDLYYPTFEYKLSYIIYTLSKERLFKDANKRTAVIVGLLFMYLNGFTEARAKKYIEGMEDMVIRLHDKDLDRFTLKNELMQYLR